MNILVTSLVVTLFTFELRANDQHIIDASPECGQLRSRIVNGSLAIEFEELYVETNLSPFDEKTCHLKVKNIKVPKGKQFRPIQAFVDGEVFTSECGAALVEIDYTWMEETIAARREFSENISKGQNFILETARADWWSFSKCSSKDQYVAIEGNFHIAVNSFPQDRFTSSLFLANQETRTSAFWEWEWRDCQAENPWLGKKFRSRYTNTLGQWLVGDTELAGEVGNYNLDAGDRGIFYDVSYHDQGLTAQGYWRFQSGATGWFRFVIGLDEDAFEGHWGYGQTIGDKPRGQWKGYLKAD